MDIQMPDLDGLEAIRRLRAAPDPRLAATPIIALTALAMPDDIDRMRGAGFDAIMIKPLDLVRFLLLIDKAPGTFPIVTR